MLIQVIYEGVVYLWCIIGESLLGVLILTLSVLNSLLLFRDKVSQTSCAEKAIKGLGRGSGRDRVTVTTVTLKNGYAVLRPSLQKGFPQ